MKLTYNKLKRLIKEELRRTRLMMEQAGRIQPIGSAEARSDLGLRGGEPEQPAGKRPPARRRRRGGNRARGLKILRGQGYNSYEDFYAQLKKAGLEKHLGRHGGDKRWGRGHRKALKYLVGAQSADASSGSGRGIGGEHGSELEWSQEQQAGSEEDFADPEAYEKRLPQTTWEPGGAQRKQLPAWIQKSWERAEEPGQLPLQTLLQRRKKSEEPGRLPHQTLLQRRGERK